MLKIDMEETRHLMLIIDDGHRTTVTLAHQDGIKLFQDIQEYYGRLQYGHGTDEKPTSKGLLARLKERFLPKTPVV